MKGRHHRLDAARHHAEVGLRRLERASAPGGANLSGKLWALVIPLLIGGGAGLALFFALQRRRLRWTWALLGAPLAYLLYRLDAPIGTAVGVATVVAVGLGLRDHQEAVQHGGEDARIMRDTVGPLRWTWTKVRTRHAVDEPVKGETLAIGRNARGQVCRVPFGVNRGVHALVAGATGSGKTVDLTAISCAHVLAGQGVIVANPKPDRDMRRRLEAAAAHAGVAFHHWSPTGTSVYNPLARGNPTEIADKALAGHQWSEPHYELATQRLLLQVLPTLREAEIWPPTIADLANYMVPERLDLLAAKLSEQTADRVNNYVDGLGARGAADLAGGRDRLAVLADGQLGPLLGNPGPGQASIDLAVALAAGDVVYFDLDADRYPAAAKLLGAALVIDLVGLTADLQGGQAGGLLVIDEFSAIAAAQVERLFARARSAGLSLLLGTQSLADLRAASADERSDTLTEKVLSNIEYSVVHRIGDPDSAERLARLAGTAPSWSTTQRVGPDGPSLLGRDEGTRTREREFLVGPDAFKRLRTGEAIAISPKAKRSAAGGDDRGSDFDDPRCRGGRQIVSCLVLHRSWPAPAPGGRDLSDLRERKRNLADAERLRARHVVVESPPAPAGCIRRLRGRPGGARGFADQRRCRLGKAGVTRRCRDAVRAGRQGCSLRHHLHAERERVGNPVVM